MLPRVGRTELQGERARFQVRHTHAPALDDLPLQGGGGASAESALGVMKKLKAAAPTELQDEWDTVVFAYEDLVQAVQSTGVPIDSFGARKRPEGVSLREWMHSIAQRSAS